MAAEWGQKNESFKTILLPPIYGHQKSKHEQREAYQAIA
jgi:hypothetical protein